MMKKFRILIFVSAFFWTSEGFSQIKQEGGLIIFEGQRNVFDLYFVKTPTTSNLISYLNNHDSVNAVYLGPPGDDMKATGSFKWYLSTKIRFDTLSLTISQKNQLEQEYEEPSILLSKYGFIQYSQSMSYKLIKRHKKFYLNNRIIIVTIEDFVPIESFSLKAVDLK